VPIWIGGNSARARQRVADFGDGWNPFPAPATLARTSRTLPLETVDDLARLLDDLWQRVEAAGRDRASIDVAFTTSAGGSPASETFDGTAHLAALDELAALGVTWVGVYTPSDSLARSVDVLARYGEHVIEPSRRHALRTP
jgi:alkanesulfonate monooxygenase SsuD/methylene tetrahydromethanopterin reductase-like flavin-dependent oxidoreductase (luciferase family)